MLKKFKTLSCPSVAALPTEHCNCKVNRIFLSACHKQRLHNVTSNTAVIVNLKSSILLGMNAMLEMVKMKMTVLHWYTG